MQLSDRGIRYQVNSGNVSTTETNITATYRGNTYHVPQVTEIIPQPTVQLKYRGVAYPAQQPQTATANDMKGQLNPEFI